MFLRHEAEWRQQIGGSATARLRLQQIPDKREMLGKEVVFDRAVAASRPFEAEPETHAMIRARSTCDCATCSRSAGSRGGAGTGFGKKKIRAGHIVRGIAMKLGVVRLTQGRVGFAI